MYHTLLVYRADECRMLSCSHRHFYTGTYWYIFCNFMKWQREGNAIRIEPLSHILQRPAAARPAPFGSHALGSALFTAAVVGVDGREDAAAVGVGRHGRKQ